MKVIFWGSADYMNFTERVQPLVDTAFLSHTLIRAPKQLLGNLDSSTQENLIKALLSTWKTRPYYSNWILFTGIVEAALQAFRVLSKIWISSVRINRESVNML